MSLLVSHELAFRRRWRLAVQDGTTIDTMVFGWSLVYSDILRM